MPLPQRRLLIRTKVAQIKLGQDQRAKAEAWERVDKFL
jgi:hypothetical protein